MSVSTMKKLTVLAYDKDADAIVRKLMNLKCVDIQSVPPDMGLMPAQTARYDQQRAEAERRLSDIRRALPIMAKYTQRKMRFGRVVHTVDRAAFCQEGRDRIAWDAVTKTVKAVGCMEALAVEKTQCEARRAALEPWLEYDAPLNEQGSKRTAMLLGVLPAQTDLPAVRADVDAMGAYLELAGEDEHGFYVVITMMRSDLDEVEARLASNGFLKTAFADVDTTARMAYEKAAERLTEIDAEIFKLEDQLRDLSELLDDVEILSDIEATAVNLCMLRRKLAATKNCAVLTGWIPADAEARVTDSLSVFECACEIEEPDENEEPPVLLRNNRWGKSFEWVLGMYSYPKYGSFDPTFIMSIFYFIIFGLMFADVGYGLILIAACFGGVKLLNPKKGMRDMLTMFGYCGISCVIMGVLFGGWFGDLPTAIMSAAGIPTDTPIARFFASGLWLNPLDDPMTFLIISLGIGVVHLIAGMAVNFAVLCKKGQAAEAFCTIVPYWVLFAGFGLFLINGTVGAYVSLAGALMILLLMGYGQKSIGGRIVKGLGGLYGLINYAADLLSYCRVLALGMVAGVIAKVINMITALGNAGVIGFVFMLIVLLLGHGLNLLINILGTFVHTARLQYIEFFGKFYEDGGTPFTPALPSEEYSEDTTADA